MGLRILAIADVEDDVLLARLGHGAGGLYDAVVSCGDLSPAYLDCVASLANAPLFFVRGNHDTYDPAEVGGTNLCGRVVELGGVRFAGLEGSLNYREGIVGYSEAEMWRRALSLELRVWAGGGMDVLVTHAPPRGFGDMDDLPHRGFRAYCGLLERQHPTLMLHGHVHLSYGMRQRERMHPAGTRIVNAYAWCELEL